MKPEEIKDKATRRDSDSELVVLDETGSEASGDAISIEVSEAEDVVDDDDDGDDVIVIGECEAEEGGSSARKRRRTSTFNEDEALDLLRKENHKLKEELSLYQGVDSFKLSDGTDNAVLKVLFYDAGFSKLFKPEVEKYLSELFVKYRGGDPSPSKPTEQHVPPAKSSPPPPFFIDNCSPSKNANNAIVVDNAPMYKTDFSDILVEEEVVEKEEKNSIPTCTIVLPPKPKQTCFNCMGDHMLPDCPEPQDRQRIAQNRKEHYAKFGGRQTRYHAELDPKFSKFTPGTISYQLRQALSLKENQVPPYIYKMRLLGYPPGWLLDAEVSSSGLIMYDSEGKEVVEDNLEEGEVYDSERKVQYDSSKLVDFPGFNVPVAHGVVDEGERLGYPPMLHEHQKCFFALHMKGPEVKPFSRRKSQVEAKEVILGPRDEEDMEIEGLGPEAGKFLTIDDKCKFIPPLPREQSSQMPPLPSEPPPQSSDSESEIVSSQHVSRSPSLADLEDEKQRLMLQLGESSIGTPQHRRTSAADTNLSDSSSSQESWAKSSRSASKSMALGTPVVTSVSPFFQLPLPDKFSVGITEHMNFENLPDATGNYDKFKGILDKVRSRQDGLGH